MSDLRIETTAIEGLLVLHLPVHGDSRGWFKENWQRAKMTELGLPDFGPVQHNISFNAARGTTRGVHAEPWDKLVSVVTGHILGGWVDLREGPGFGTVVTVDIGPDKAVFVPRGVGNSYQSLQDATTYTYLVNQHWSAAAKQHYTYANVYDPALGIDWPIPRDQAELSEADQNHPMLADVTPMKPRRTLIVGAGGQVSRALQRLLPDAVVAGSGTLDLTSPDQVAGFDFSGFDTIINTAAFTSVDAAETADGRRMAWQLNATGVALLAEAARAHRLRLVHISSDYVFDGTQPEHDEHEPFAPLGVYGQTKAAGDLAAAGVPQHWIVRTSWVVGEGRNFVATMAALAAKGASPSVVDDQFGRLTFADDLAAGIVHLLSSGAAPGTYNLSNSGPEVSWAQVAARVFELCGRDASDVTPVSTADYAAGKLLAPRPAHSGLALGRIIATGFTPPDADARLVDWLAAHAPAQGKMR
ncbi:sugar nucleotide-binding protein [Propionibacteriaceae bacterium G1746]|uniref:sugar nucleotide-binding protein n=1 Tax=Aestuariimicrobium sp. G57 TaxID=3418485 RepID=UPI003C14AC4D